MNPTDLDQAKLSSLSSPAPFSFGQHPNFERSYREHLSRFSLGKEISLSELADSRHPEVFVIPRNNLLDVVDEWGDTIGFERTVFPFSSADFYVDLEEKGLFHEFGRSEAFSRLGGISQLGYLVPPRPEEWDKNVSIAYLLPQFSHTRWIHSLVAAILVEIVLARNGFSEKEREPVVLTAGLHDIAIPAGGDSVKRVDPKGLDEEENFARVLQRGNLDKQWAEKFSFDLILAQKWVKGEGMFGRLLDAIDKISYTALDCFFLGLIRPGNVRNLCLQYPLIMDIWQDIRFASDRTELFFTRPEHLFRFLLLRAYEFQELLFNPYSRALDLFLKKLVKPLYKKGIITKEHLLTGDDKWLEQVLGEYYPEEIRCYIEPEELSWKRFDTAKERRDFCRKFKVQVDHIEHIAGFKSGLDWLVSDGGNTAPLKQVISRDKIELLEGVVASTRGYYVYYKS